MFNTDDVIDTAANDTLNFVNEIDFKSVVKDAADLTEESIEGNGEEAGGEIGAEAVGKNEEEAVGKNRGEAAFASTVFTAALFFLH